MRRREVIKEKIRALRKEYKETVSSHESAWRTYGSELCAGAMERKEVGILFKIQHFEKLLKMPEINKDKEALDLLVKQAEQNIVLIEREEAALAVRKKEAQDYKSLLEEIREIPLHT